MTDAPRPYQDTPAFRHLRMYARAEQRTRAELDEVRDVLMHAGHTEATLNAWAEHATALQHRLDEQARQTDLMAATLLGHDLPDAAALAQQARALEDRTRTPRAPTTCSGPRHEAPCPVPQCRTTVRHADHSTTHEPRQLPINPGLADRPYTCPCDRAATLSVGRTARGDWTLRPWTPFRDDREEINLIAHALVTGQTYQDRRWNAAVNTAPDATTGRMTEAGATMMRLDRDVRLALQAGHLQRAFELAEQASAAEYSYKLHSRTYRRHRREHQESGRWHNAEWFWIALSVPARSDGAPERDIVQRFLFNLIAVYDEETGSPVVANADDIERETGIPVGPDGWSQLMEFLGRIDPAGTGGKPGQAPDLHQLVYREDRGRLTPRRHVAERYPRALVALEALRRTLIPDRGPAGDRSPALARPPLPTPDWAEKIAVDTDAHNPDNPD